MPRDCDSTTGLLPSIFKYQLRSSGHFPGPKPHMDTPPRVEEWVEGSPPGQEPVQDGARKLSPAWQTRLGGQGRAAGAGRHASLSLPPPHGTFQRLFMRYFFNKIWDLRRRLQRLAFSARLLSQGWARHWAALIRALWEGMGGERGQCAGRHPTLLCHPGNPRGVGVSAQGEPHPCSLTMRLETKSLASSDTASKVSSSKYQLPESTLFRVSVSSSPRKGERPLSLQGGHGRARTGSGVVEESFWGSGRS